MLKFENKLTKQFFLSFHAPPQKKKLKLIGGGHFEFQ